MWYNNITKIFTRRAEPIRMIGDPDNQLSDKWSSAVTVVLSSTFLIAIEGRPYSDSEFEKRCLLVVAEEVWPCNK
jgi:hypothetical protein